MINKSIIINISKFKSIYYIINLDFNLFIFYQLCLVEINKNNLLLKNTTYLSDKK